ncbi:MAG TPA: glycerophosphodiester phosphodiesterase family protein [Nocardioidaceae bacterium]|nr:glycerophosphodiester phosphodiesterase family protein [Nocardioidaceae bacterium]
MTRPRTGFPFLDAGREQGTVLAFAHRGGARHPDLVGLENTLVAFEHAVRLGYSYLETDVHATRDGELLAFHDAHLDRVTSGRGGIGAGTYGELRTALVAGREPIPRLADLLEHLGTARFNVDLKSDAAVAPLAALVERTGSHDRVCVGAFSERRLAAFRRLVSRPVATSYGPFGVGLSRYAPGRLAHRLLAGRGEALQVPHRHRGLRIVTGGFVARAHAAGRPVHVWVVDDPDEMELLLDLGVDGLFTDRTDLLRDVLTRRGQWTGELP